MCRHQKSGLSLLELSIVLAVIGLAIGGLYIAASAAIEVSKEKKAHRQLVELLRNIRSAYGAIGLPPPVGGNGEMTADRLIADRVAPADMPRLNNIQLSSPYGPVSIVNTLGATGGGAVGDIRIIFGSLSSNACMNLLSGMFPTASSVRNMGLVKVTSNKSGPPHNYYGVMDVTYNKKLSNGVSISEARAQCPVTPISLSMHFLRNL